ncbi:MAG: MBOAT family O-acyltransferase [Leptospiraceae bacterium]|nr:MBOAT family O-acyltransferase [Leptospiraceae bacterium]
MIFNSVDFLLFFPVVYCLYLVSNFRVQNILLLLASYFFYGYWDYRFLSLLALSTIIDYFTSIGIHQAKTENEKKAYLYLSMIANLGMLGFFKYFNFFISSTATLLNTFGFHPNIPVLEIALPLGISFYTFQTMSYTIDVYRGQLVPTKNFWDFALFVSFFPQLVAGPIERATNLLPQILSKRVVTFEEIQRGTFLILLGYFKKVYVADNLALIVDPIFNDNNSSGAMIFFGLFAFHLQVYGDFAGYSDIARGLAKFLGFELMRNFAHPMFSENVMEFWRRWHISFMSWLRDYVYFSIGKKEDSETKKNINNLFVYSLSGLWHGASWSFVIWGTLNGITTLFYKYFNKFFPPRTVPYQNKFVGGMVRLTKIAITFTAVTLPLVFFRSKNLEEAYFHMKSMLFNWSGGVNIDPKSFVLGKEYGFDPKQLEKFFKTIFLLYLVEFYQFSKDDEFAIFKLPVYLRVLLYVSLFYAIIILGNFSDAFIYFVF